MYDTNARPWIGSAPCAQVGGDGFFPEMRDKDSTAPVHNVLSWSEAKRVCQACEVRAECLRWALDNDERYGIWGGLTAEERKRLGRAS